MVISGKPSTISRFTLAKFERDRIRLPPLFVERVGLTGKDRIDCWLLVVTPGRYRLLRQSMSGDGDLSRIISQIEEVEEQGDLIDLTENNSEAAIPARLIPCVASPRGPGWRIHIPKEAKKLAAEKAEPSAVFLLVVAGFVEIWFPDTLREAVSLPISELLS